MNKKQRFGSWLAIAAIATPLLFVSPAQGITPEPTPAPTTEELPSATPAAASPIPSPEESILTCTERQFVVRGPSNDLGGLGLGTPGEIAVLRIACMTDSGEELFHRDETYVWADRPKDITLTVEVPSDWPWSPERIAEGRAATEYQPHPNVVSACIYPLYLCDEFLTTGKILWWSSGSPIATWVLQP